ncbi:MAG: transcription repressor NadR [Bacillaceae bacterium]|nr:transcription repressor NadR [Bacillaceae bacterium]
MTQDKKLTGELRRQRILDILKKSAEPLTGTMLARETGVSRQAIVQDIALLKARNEPIMATPQGYLYFRTPATRLPRRVIACRHNFEDTEKELNILVDNGVKVLDVIVEHPIYGEINGSLMIETRLDVKRFMNKVHKDKANLLSSLTGGVHLHTVEAENDDQLDAACRELEKEGILLNQDV